jgi:EAL domain-containing protein (putative c-di-GMP-specific phosphodiesterase class I)/GGDEF domain-containing protein
MTTTSDNLIDYPAFGISEEDLASLRALAGTWAHAVTYCSARMTQGAALTEFVACTAMLPSRLGDVHWQRRWLQAWHRLSGKGVPLADIFGLLNRAVGQVEIELFGNRAQVGRLEFSLFAVLRRAAVAAVSGALELAEHAATEGSRFPGEFDAIRALRALAREGKSGAVMSVSLENAQRFANLSASDLHALPALLAERLRRSLRSQDQLFRGRDGEWLLLLPDATAIAQPVLTATQIVQAFDEPLHLLSGRPVRVEVKIGIAMFPIAASEDSEPVGAARVARLTLKLDGEQFAFFDPQTEREWKRRCSLADQLLSALRADELELYLQPQVEGADSHCIGAEMLLRWRTSEGAWVPPPTIIELIEENGWRPQLTDWLLRTAMRMASELGEAEIHCGLSINLLAGDLLDPDLPELLQQGLDAWRIPAERFTLELTESAMMADPGRGIVVMRQLREIGVRLALDDFGTGYSSLSYLAMLPLNEIKIDRSFVVSMFDSSERLRIVRTIIDLTHDLGMEPIAEGIEEPVQREKLTELGCDRAQGYLYGKPMPLKDFINWYRSRQA